MECPTFGQPLVLAATNGQEDILKALAKYFVSCRYHHHIDEYEYQFEAAISAALVSEHWTIALLVLRIFHEYDSAVFSRKIEKWNPLAFSSKDPEVLQISIALRRCDDAEQLQKAF